MLNQLGERNIGHGVIKEFSEEIMLSQLAKRNFNSDEYDEGIIEEFKKEQPTFYKLMQHTLAKYAIQYADNYSILGTDEWEESVEYWMKRVSFLIAFQYKIMSVGIECQIMEDK